MGSLILGLGIFEASCQEGVTEYCGEGQCRDALLNSAGSDSGENPQGC